SSFAAAYTSWAAQPASKGIAEISQPGPSTSSTVYREMVWGNPKAPVTVMEYASLTCPHCAHFSNDVFPRIKQAYIDTGKIRFVYRDYPIDNMALGAALILRCAPGESGKELIAAMFKNLQDWQASAVPLDNLKRYAAQVGLASSEVDSCLRNQ